VKTQEAIEILKMYKHPNPKDDFVYKENKELDDIINLLQQGWVDKKIIEIIKKRYDVFVSLKKSPGSFVSLPDLINEIERR